MKIKEKRFFVILFLAVFVFTVSASDLSLKLTFGPSYMVVGDTNQYLSDYGQQNFGENVFGFFHKGNDLSGELSLGIWSNIKLFLESGILSTGMKDNKHQTGQVSYSFDNFIRAVPLIFGIKLDLNLKKLRNTPEAKISGFVKAGVGYYFTSFEMNYKYESYSYWLKREQNARGGAFGLNGSLGVEIELSKRWSFVIEGKARAVKVNNFWGEYKSSDSMNNFLDLPIQGTLYFYRYSNFRNGLLLTQLRICGEPVGKGIDEVRPALADLSGFSLNFGFKINL